MPANKYASSHMNQAYARLLHTLQELEPPAFSLYPTPDQFECAKDFAVKFAEACDDMMAMLVCEANFYGITPISTADRYSMFSDKLHDSSFLDDLTNEAEQRREDALERA